MTDLIQEIEKAIINRAANHTKENIYDEYSAANFEEGALFATNFILPLLKRVLSQRDDYILMRKRHIYTSKQFAADEQKIESDELNKELLKLLGSDT